MGKLFDSVSGNKDRKKYLKRAKNQMNVAEFGVDSLLGNAQMTADGLTATGGAGSSLASPFEQFAAQLLAGGGASFNLNPNDAFTQLTGAAAPNAYNAAGTDALAALGNFDPNAFATQQFERLNALAAPGEETAASSTANSLFARGRLGAGDSVSGQVFRDLDLSQRLARDSRLLQSIGLANQEQTRLAGQATALGAAGNQFQNDSVARFLSAIQGGQGIAGQNFNQAVGATGAINQALNPQLTALQLALQGSALGTEVNLARGNTLAGFDPSQGANAVGGAVGGLIGGIFGG